MKRAIERISFAVGAVFAVLDLAWLLVLLTHEDPNGIGHPVFLYVVLAHGLIVWRIFQPFGGPWRPIVRPTPKLVMTARLLLGLATAAVIASVVWFVSSASLRALEFILPTLGFLISTYAAFHWAIRPERIFGTKVLRVINPWTLFRKIRW